MQIVTEWIDLLSQDTAFLLPGHIVTGVVSPDTSFTKMLNNWNTLKSQVHCFVVDNAANMKKAMVDGGYVYLGCFAHTLQLVVNDGILSQQYVQDVLAKCRRIVGHFKHSQLVYSRLKEIQTTLGMPHH